VKLNQPVYVLGGYQTDFARNWAKEGKHISALVREALEGALIETRVGYEEIEAAFVGNFASELYSSQGMLGAFVTDCDPRLRGLPTMRCEAACASGGVAAIAAMAHVMAGMYDLVCVLGVEQMKTVDAAQGSAFLGCAAWFEHEAKGVEFPFPKIFGRLADEYEARYGLDPRHLAAISDKNYRNARLNPNAQTREWYMSLEHAGTVSRYNQVMYGHLKVADCSQISDGAACVFLASARAAQAYADRHGVLLDAIPRIAGWGQTTAQMRFADKVAASVGEDYVLPWTHRAIRQALDRAELTDCWQLDAIETHDCFTSSEYMAIDHFGLTPPGRSWQAIEEGVVEIGGRLPVNPSGGLIGGGHPVGATGIRQLLDAQKQVAGNAGEYQVPGARHVATLNIGGSATTTVCLVVAR
jgi:acetyl-CoA C-acetyltransferase